MAQKKCSLAQISTVLARKPSPIRDLPERHKVLYKHHLKLLMELQKDRLFHLDYMERIIRKARVKIALVNDLHATYKGHYGEELPLERAEFIVNWLINNRRLDLLTRDY